MKKIIFVLLLLSVSLFAKYMDNHSCKECHEKIYEEFQSSYHSKSYFNDALHRKIADAADSKKYACAPCHMPAADNLKALLTGEARPDPTNITHTDAVSCYFCHTIAYVKQAHQRNINTTARQANNYKPTLYGRLHNPDNNDKHASVNNPIYAKNVCKGCHSHKLNENNVTIFSAMQRNQSSEKCIECHMPEVEGGAEKMDKRARGHHASHRFPGIHDPEFRKKGVDINITTEGDKVYVTLHNKMAHPLIIQPARVKYLKLQVKRGDKTIWQNYKNDPSEDKEAWFAYSFKQNGKKVIIPAHATGGDVHNLGANETATLTYHVPELKKGDRITAALYVQLAKDDCTSAIDLKDSNLTTPILIKKESLTVGEPSH